MHLSVPRQVAEELQSSTPSIMKSYLFPYHPLSVVGVAGIFDISQCRFESNLQLTACIRRL